MSAPQRILVLGASGYIGQHLLPRLAAAGHTVTAAARNIEPLAKRQLPGVTCQPLDLLWPQALPELLAGTDTLFYLVHSMGDGPDFIAHERQAALNLRDALRNQPVKQIIYLSSLQAAEETTSAHLLARKLTGEILRDAGVPVTELRAGMVIGAGSAAFEVMRDMVNNLPVLTPPRWVRSRTTPIALENLLGYLKALAEQPAEDHRLFEAAGPDVMSYQTLFERFMALSGRKRPLLPVPLPTSWISVWFLQVITSVPPSLAKALIQGLHHDLIADDRALRALIPQHLIPIDDAIKTTLDAEASPMTAADWGAAPQTFARWRADYGFYPKQAGYTLRTDASAAQLWEVINRIGGKEGYFFGNALWKTRAGIDLLLGHKLPKGRPDTPQLSTGDNVDSWKVIVVEPEKELTLLFGMKAPGLGRLSFTVRDEGKQRRLDVRAWWHPRGIAGLLYWLIMIPAHLFIFRGMAQRIARLAKKSA